MFNKNECRVYYEGKLILTGGQDPLTELSQLPVNPTFIKNTSLALRYVDLHISTDTLNVGAQTIQDAINVQTILYIRVN